jgi:hypothetical protein
MITSIAPQTTIHHFADWIWDQLNTNSTVSSDTFAWVAADLEKAEICADEYRLEEAGHWIISAARQVFGVYSETYAGFVRFYS